MDEGVFELAQNVRKLTNEVKRCEKKCEELQSQLAVAQELEEKLTPLRQSDNYQERKKYLDAFTQRGLIQASLISYQSRLIVAKYDLDKINSLQNEAYQAQPE